MRLVSHLRVVLPRYLDNMGLAIEIIGNVVLLFSHISLGLTNYIIETILRP